MIRRKSLREPGAAAGPAPRAGERIVKCPRCGKPAVYGPSNPWRPFCSEQCRQIDLGAWASASYRIADGEDDPSADEPGE